MGTCSEIQKKRQMKKENWFCLKGLKISFRDNAKTSPAGP